jgi:hypothetical protein
MAEDTEGNYIPDWATTPPSQRKTVSAPAFDIVLAGCLSNGWKVTSDGPTGVQLEKPKKMRGLDKVCLVFGLVTLCVFGLGLIFILIAVLDYCFFTKPEMRFLPRR